MLTFSLRAKVFCTDGPEGELTAIIIHPERQQVTHLVARYREEQRIVPIAYVDSSDARTIHLNCSDTEMQTMPPFVEERFTHVQNPETPELTGEELPLGYSPHLIPLDTDVVPLVVEYVPEGELALHRDTPIEATDGPIGHVSELQVTPNDNHITHLIAQTGGLFHRHELSLPLAAIDHITDDGVYLRWNKQTIEELPTAPG